MKIGFFITARLKSSRLKRKILLDIEGEPILQHIINRCKETNNIDGVVLCTSTNRQDSILYDYALQNQIQFFAGSENDVLDRLLSAAEYYNYDAFVSITADNPLFSILLAESLVDWYQRDNLDFIFSRGLPIGCCPYLLDVKALKIANHCKNQTDTEIWGPFVNRSDFFKIGNLNVVNSPYKEEKRLTCDYREDYRLIQSIYKKLKTDTPRIHEIINLFKMEPELWNMNEMHKQRALSAEIISRIDNQFDKSRESALKFAVDIGKKLEPMRLDFDIEI